mmetsp:Transcript_10629/g.19718  ORF Transcript_10629/g.19718 Transcript_10629/m.19718 type:complete len:210 (-) Transcript_10629:701-1330(-)
MRRQTSSYSWRFLSTLRSKSCKAASYCSFLFRNLTSNSASIFSNMISEPLASGMPSFKSSATGSPCNTFVRQSTRTLARSCMLLSRAAERSTARLCSCSRASFSLRMLVVCSSWYLSCAISRFFSASCARHSSTLRCASMIFCPARRTSSERTRMRSSSWWFTSMRRASLFSRSAFSKAARSRSACARATSSRSNAKTRRRQRRARAKP